MSFRNRRHVQYEWSCFSEVCWYLLDTSAAVGPQCYAGRRQLGRYVYSGPSTNNVPIWQWNNRKECFFLNERVYWIMISGRFNKVGWGPRDLIILRRIIQPILNKFGKVLVIVHVTTGMSEPFTFRQWRLLNLPLLSVISLHRQICEVIAFLWGEPESAPGNNCRMKLGLIWLSMAVSLASLHCLQPRTPLCSSNSSILLLYSLLHLVILALLAPLCCMCSWCFFHFRTLALLVLLDPLVPSTTSSNPRPLYSKLSFMYGSVTSNPRPSPAGLIALPDSDMVTDSDSCTMQK